MERWFASASNSSRLAPRDEARKRVRFPNRDVAGHYLSAVSLMWAATGDPRFNEPADYVVEQLKEVQDKHGDGYLSALEGGRECFNKGLSNRPIP